MKSPFWCRRMVDKNILANFLSLVYPDIWYGSFNDNSLFAFPIYFFSKIGCSEFDASLSAAYTFSAIKIWSEGPNNTGRFTRLKTQNIRIPVDCVHSGYRIPKSIDHQIENRFEPICQRLSRFIRFWQVRVSSRAFYSFLFYWLFPWKFDLLTFYKRKQFISYKKNTHIHLLEKENDFLWIHLLNSFFYRFFSIFTTKQRSNRCFTARTAYECAISAVRW